MGAERSSKLVSVLAFGAAAFLIACLSILDMYLPRPYDGVILDPDRSELVVRAVAPGSGAATAGIQPGDRIAGIGRQVVRTPPEAAQAISRHRIGERVPYLLERNGSLFETDVELGPSRLGDPYYLYYCGSGFLFFLIGLFVLLQRPDSSQGAPGRVFFALCTLFLLFLVCRLRPASYSWIDGVVLNTGTLSLLVLPAAFLHFFLVFPRRLRLAVVNPAEPMEGSGGRLLRAAESFVNESPNFFRLLYLLPPLFFVVTLALGELFSVRLRLVSGAPISSWVLMGDYLVLGLLALLGSMLQAEEGRERRQIATVFIGTVVGVTPFLLLGVVFPSLLRTDRYLFWGVVPLALVPLTFAYAIVRFQFFDIRVIVRRSLLYTVATALVAGIYGVSIAAFNLLFRGSSVGSSPYFTLLLVLAVIAVFDPLRRRLQEPVDRFFFREVYDARRAIEEVSDAVVREFSLERLEALLATRLSEIMHLEWAALYCREGARLTSQSAVPPLPREFSADLLLTKELARQDEPVRPGLLEPLKALDPRSRRVLEQLTQAGARLLVPLRSREQLHAILALGPKRSEEEFGRDDLQLVRTLANQGAVALENARLLRERTHQMELEKELEIARRVQFSLIPAHLPAPPGWQVAARCVPARQVGGDFYDALDGHGDGDVALVVGDVSGKSVAGAMLMVAAREVLHTAALGGATPEQLFQVANQRLYTPRHRLFVALTYLLLEPSGAGRYALAGQPAPLLRRRDGGVIEMPAPQHRLPIGALKDVRWDVLPLRVEPGDLLLLYSDGVTDARDPGGRFFGEERLAQVLAGANGDAASVIAEVMGAVEAFTAGGEPYDDITMVAVRWMGR
ncbi:MAG TPA: SpoIIE family protein phosphatase [Thermoanaerobaculaceae bacterium]|nr:SpoIIE family protein phosphatase [Thermoanaerobaculaceae bacterium]